MFFVLGVVQCFAFTTLYLFMKETTGLSASEKKSLYIPAKKEDLDDKEKVQE